MKILLINTVSDNVINFRKELIGSLKSKGHKIYVICTDDDSKKAIESLGVDFFGCKISNRSVNFFKDFKWRKNLVSLIKKIEPDTIFTFQAKPNIYGGWAANRCNIPFFAMVEGAGSVFATNSLRNIILRKVLIHLYKKAFRKANKVFFLNNDDKQLFLDHGIIEKERTEIINGIGIDLVEYQESPPQLSPITFIMVARLLPEKGIIEYCEAAKIVKKNYPNVRFLLLGKESTLQEKDLEKYDECVEYLGYTNNVKYYLKNSSVFVLPSSYREGIPRSTMEAMAIGRAVITTNNVGCKETVIDEYNGFLVPMKNAELLIEGMMKFIKQPALILEMGHHSRELCEKKFDCNIINSEIINVVGTALGEHNV